jgi:hypothetical protein
MPPQTRKADFLIIQGLLYKANTLTCIQLRIGMNEAFIWGVGAGSVKTGIENFFILTLHN